jgi:ABC-type transport system involved in Fe-S cluster assembly fused permease/ATPase subunit
MAPSVLEQEMQVSEITMLCAYASAISVFETVGLFSHNLVQACRPNTLNFNFPQSVMKKWQTHEILCVSRRVD